ncbi:YoaK family protein [Novosphingobium sp.]|uniref:YoaK family protein n=1 Tax=Novosphingobium sp. TaxID=1874826 RepID=UPI00262085C7|nr:YoaK family protein [Novosphingobium sp.]
MLRYDPERRRLAIALSGLAGFVDAVGFLSAEGHFVSFMSGNSTRLGVALSTLSGTALFPAVLIAGFVCGVALGALLALRAGSRRKPVILGVVTALLLIGAAARGFGSEPVMLAALVLAMGVTNNTFQRDGEVTVGLTYMTGALVRLGQGLALWLVGKAEPGWIQWGLLWCGLLTGAVLGASLQSRFPFGCLWIAAAWAAMMTLVAIRLPAES